MHANNYWSTVYSTCTSDGAGTAGVRRPVARWPVLSARLVLALVPVLALVVEHGPRLAGPFGPARAPALTARS